MSNEEKRPWAQVWPVANKLREALAPYCQVLEIAGSLRRKRPMVADIELVALPNFEEARDLFGKVTHRHDHLLARLDELAAEEKIQKGTKWGTAYRKFYVRSSTKVEYAVDVFVAKPDNFGNIFVIRTGSSDFSTHLMVHLNGLGMRHSEGHLYDANGEVVPCPTEEAFFAAIQHPIIPPEMRHDGLWRPML